MEAIPGRRGLLSARAGRGRAALLLPLLLLLSGCASQRVLRYSWGSVVAVDRNTLIAKCSANPGKWDTGEDKSKWAPVSGCVITGPQKQPEIWIAQDAPWCVLAHELAHLEGVADPNKSGFGCR